MKTRRTIPQALMSAVLHVLECAADAWRCAYFALVIAPLADPRSNFSARRFWRLMKLLYRSEAELSRGIASAARRMLGLPALDLPIEAFYLPPPKSPDHVRQRVIRHGLALPNARRMAVRLAQRIVKAMERLAADRLADLRQPNAVPTDATAFARILTPSWMRGIPAPP